MEQCGSFSKNDFRQEILEKKRNKYSAKNSGDMIASQVIEEESKDDKVPFP